MENWLETVDGGVLLTVRVLPRASRNQLVGLYQDALKIRLAAPPVDGKANKALTRYIARLLDISPQGVQVVKGETSRCKKLYIRGINPDQVNGLLKHVQG